MTKGDQEKLIQQVRKMLLLVEKGKAKTIASIKHVSQSGMTRDINFIIVYVEDDKPKIYNLSWAMVQLDVARDSKDYYGVRVQGCGMDMIFATLYALHNKVFGDDKPRKDYVLTTQYEIL